MQVIKTVAAMQRIAQRWRAEGSRIGLVPTMGFLHDGHLSLIKRARQSVGKIGKVVVSIYVNPTQFGPKEDFARYPRDFARDARLCEAAGVDVIFAPADDEMYPKRPGAAFSTYVAEELLSKSMEGASRPTHFRGVTTIVAKLFNITQPNLAIFGAKDFQQATIVKRMVRDLNFPLRIVVAPTFREPDGLAKSSRNKYLEGTLRAQATVLWRCIETAQARVREKKEPIAAARLKAELKKLIEKEPDARLDYIEFFEPETLTAVTQIRSGVRMALAVFIGKTRLIDNALL